MGNGRKRLAQWIERSKMSQREVARLLGFHVSVLNKVLKGHRTPGLATALRLERVTGIPVESWTPTRNVKRATADLDAADNLAVVR